MLKSTFLFTLFSITRLCSGFVPAENRWRLPTSSTKLDAAVDRRDFVAGGIAGFSSLLMLAGTASAAEAKVLVLGGTGMCGSEVVKILQSMGVQVVATSTDGRDGTVALDFRQSDTLASSIESLAQGCTAVISCVGVIGTDNDAIINSGSGVAAMAAKKAGVKHFSYISVAPEVREFGKGFDFLQDYMEGKAYSEAAITNAFGTGDGSYTLIEPTFIYGGDKFALKPPRVANGYGQFIEALLSSAPFRAATNVAPEGFIKIALEPPVSATSVAKAAIAGALGKLSMPVLDTHDKIADAAKLV